MITAQQLKAKWDSDPNALIKAIQGCLVDFGYEGLEFETVSQAIKNFYDGEAPQGVIEMFVAGWLKDGVD